MSTSDYPTPAHDQLSVIAPSDPPQEPFGVYQPAFSYPPQPTLPPQSGLEYLLPDYPTPQYQQLAEPLVPNLNLTFLVDDPEAEVEVDPEVWNLVTYRRNGSNNTYYVIQVPSSSDNALIASSEHVSDNCFHIPGSTDHRWPVLTSKRHTVHTIPPEFQQWMGPIQLFLDKSAEYLRPYENYVKKRRAVSAVCIMIALVIITVALILDKEDHNPDSLWAIVAAAPFCLVAILLNVFVKKGLVNGVKALKLCGKYEKSVLPSNIKVILGPYGAYWKFVLRS